MFLILYINYSEFNSLKSVDESVYDLHMNKVIEDIASISTGVYQKVAPSGDTYYLQAKHFDESGRFLPDALLGPEVVLDDRLEKHRLKDGDILLMAKGESNKACLYRESIGRAVASSTFFVIRLEQKEVDPEYLQWYLNTSPVQSVLTGLSKGTHILSLSKKALMKVQVYVPSLERQKEILSIKALWEKEKQLTLELLECKHAYYQNLLLDLAKSDSNDA